LAETHDKQFHRILIVKNSSNNYNDYLTEIGCARRGFSEGPLKYTTDYNEILERIIELAVYYYHYDCLKRNYIGLRN